MNRNVRYESTDSHGAWCGVNVETQAGIFTVTNVGSTCVDIIGPMVPSSQLISPQEAQALAQALTEAASAVVANRAGQA